MRAAWWWIDRWRKSTAYTDMTLAEQGAYRNLLDELWLRGGLLPDDDRVLAKISGDAIEWPKVRGKVMGRFEHTAEGWRNATHDEVSKGAKTFSDSQAEKGRKGADARWNSRANSRANGPVNDPPSPSPSPSPLEPLVSRSSVGKTNGHATGLPPGQRDDDRTEASIKANKIRGERRLLELVARLEACDPKQRDAPALMQLVTSYDKRDGTRIGGCVNPATLSYERVQKSIADAEELLRQWGGSGGA